MNSRQDDIITSIPRHVAIIMDGNNRWAKVRSLKGAAGHKAGVEQIRTVLRACEEHGVEVLTLFAFSSENWQRPPKEVDALMRLFKSYLENEVQEINDKGVRLRVVGSRERFSEELLRLIDHAEQATAHNTQRTLVIAADYGGRWDIAQAAKAMALQVQNGELDPNEINEELMAGSMSLSDLPAPDLCIRTGGDHRISNFLLWQFAYSELYFTEQYWPDFSTEDFEAALLDFASRQRRFGKTAEQVTGNS